MCVCVCECVCVCVCVCAQDFRPRSPLLPSSCRRRRSLDGPLLLPGQTHSGYSMRGTVSHAKVYHANGTSTAIDRYVDEEQEPPAYMSRSRRMLSEYRRGHHVLARQRRLSVRVCFPRLSCR